MRPNQIITARDVKTDEHLLGLTLKFLYGEKNPYLAQLAVQVEKRRNIWCLEAKRTKPIPTNFVMRHIFVPKGERWRVTFYNQKAYIRIWIERATGGSLSYTLEKGTFGQLFPQHNKQLRRRGHKPKGSQRGTIIA